MPYSRSSFTPSECVGPWLDLLSDGVNGLMLGSRIILANFFLALHPHPVVLSASVLGTVPWSGFHPSKVPCSWPWCPRRRLPHTHSGYVILLSFSYSSLCALSSQSSSCVLLVVPPGTLGSASPSLSVCPRQSCVVLRCHAPCMCPATVLFVCIIVLVPVLCMTPHGGSVHCSFVVQTKRPHLLCPLRSPSLSFQDAAACAIIIVFIC